jgi:hypothetical protein
VVGRNPDFECSINKLLIETLLVVSNKSLAKTSTTSNLNASKALDNPAVTIIPKSFITQKTSV